MPILAIILSFAYPSFSAARHDPLQIVGFAVAHLVMLFVAVGFVLPRFWDPFVPVEIRGREPGEVGGGEGRVVEEGVGVQGKF